MTVTTSKLNISRTKAVGAVLTLLADRTIAYHPTLAKALKSAKAAILLGQLLYWSQRTKDSDGWFYKTGKDMYDETGLSREEQENARKSLTKAGVIEEKRRGVPAKMYFRVDADRLYDLLTHWHQKLFVLNRQCSGLLAMREGKVFGV